jgi:opacity protein-like surface antigen
VLLAGLLLVVSSTSVFAAGPYVGAAGGVSIFHDSDFNSPGFPTVKASYDTGFGFNLNGGYNFDGFRVEGEFGYKASDLDKASALDLNGTFINSDATIMSYMVNGLYDYKNTSAFTPFIGAGLGLINGEFNFNGNKVEDTVFGYQLIAGVGYALNRNVTIDVSYQFQGAASDFEKNGDKFSYMSSNVYGGVRYNF